MKKGAKTALISSGIAAAVVGTAGALSYSTTNALVRVALDRNINVTPGMKIKRMISGCKNLDEIEKIYHGNANSLLGCGCKTVEIRARDGERLRGHLYLCKNAKRTVIAVHGWRTTWAKDFGGVYKFFHGNGCNVLYVEQRGQNNSGGKYIGFGLIERFDCFEWIKYVTNHPKLSSLPVYLCGVSMGATTVLMSAGFELPKNVVGIIADCGFTSPHAIWKHVMNKNLHLPYGSLRTSFARSICQKKISMSPDSYSTVEAMKKCKIPVLFVHGSHDRFVPIEMTYENYRACAAEKRLFVVPYATHGMSYFEDKSGYEAEVKRFWADHDNDMAPSH